MWDWLKPFSPFSRTASVHVGDDTVTEYDDLVSYDNHDQAALVLRSKNLVSISNETMLYAMKRHHIKKESRALILLDTTHLGMTKFKFDKASAIYKNNSQNALSLSLLGSPVGRPRAVSATEIATLRTESTIEAMHGNCITSFNFDSRLQAIRILTAKSRGENPSAISETLCSSSTKFRVLKEVAENRVKNAPQKTPIRYNASKQIFGSLVWLGMARAVQYSSEEDVQNNDTNYDCRNIVNVDTQSAIVAGSVTGSKTTVYVSTEADDWLEQHNKAPTALKSDLMSGAQKLYVYCYPVAAMSGDHLMQITFIFDNQISNIAWIQTGYDRPGARFSCIITEKDYLEAFWFDMIIPELEKLSQLHANQDRERESVENKYFDNKTSALLNKEELNGDAPVLDRLKNFLVVQDGAGGQCSFVLNNDARARSFGVTFFKGIPGRSFDTNILDAREFFRYHKSLMGKLNDSFVTNPTPPPGEERLIKRFLDLHMSNKGNFGRRKSFEFYLLHLPNVISKVYTKDAILKGWRAIGWDASGVNYKRFAQRDPSMFIKLNEKQDLEIQAAIPAFTDAIRKSGNFVCDDELLHEHFGNILCLEPYSAQKSQQLKCFNQQYPLIVSNSSADLLKSRQEELRLINKLAIARERESSRGERLKASRLKSAETRAMNLELRRQDLELIRAADEGDATCPQTERHSQHLLPNKKAKHSNAIKVEMGIESLSDTSKTVICVNPDCQRVWPVVKRNCTPGCGNRIRGNLPCSIQESMTVEISRSLAPSDSECLMDISPTIESNTSINSVAFVANKYHTLLVPKKKFYFLTSDQDIGVDKFLDRIRNCPQLEPSGIIYSTNFTLSCEDMRSLANQDQLLSTTVVDGAIHAIADHRYSLALQTGKAINTGMIFDISLWSTLEASNNKDVDTRVSRLLKITSGVDSNPNLNRERSKLFQEDAQIHTGFTFISYSNGHFRLCGLLPPLSPLNSSKKSLVFTFDPYGKGRLDSIAEILKRFNKQERIKKGIVSTSCTIKDFLESFNSQVCAILCGVICLSVQYIMIVEQRFPTVLDLDVTNIHEMNKIRRFFLWLILQADDKKKSIDLTSSSIYPNPSNSPAPIGHQSQTVIPLVISLIDEPLVEPGSQTYNLLQDYHQIWLNRGQPTVWPTFEDWATAGHPSEWPPN